MVLGQKGNEPLDLKKQWCQGIQKTVTRKGAIYEHLKTNSILATCLPFSGQAVGLQSQPFNLEKKTLDYCRW